MVTSCESSDGHSLDEGVIEQVTGCSPVTCRQILGKPFTYMPQFKMWFMTNYEPVIRGNDWGIWSRVKKIPWNYTIQPEEKDPNIVEAQGGSAGHSQLDARGAEALHRAQSQAAGLRGCRGCTARWLKAWTSLGGLRLSALVSNPRRPRSGCRCVLKPMVLLVQSERSALVLSSRRFYTEFKKRYGGKTNGVT